MGVMRVGDYLVVLLADCLVSCWEHVPKKVKQMSSVRKSGLIY